jgi:UDP-glucose 4-epimerase
MTEKHFVVTRGAAFIGAHPTERLITEDHAIVILDDFSTGNISECLIKPLILIGICMTESHYL